eukprot:COSAG04_NODE_2885_length_3423_cov_2.741340_2_plen_207_part_00
MICARVTDQMCALGGRGRPIEVRHLPRLPVALAALSALRRRVPVCPQRYYRCHLEKNATQMAAAHADSPCRCPARRADYSATTMLLGLMRRAARQIGKAISYPYPTSARAIGGDMLTAAGHRIGIRSLAEQLRVARNRLCAVADFMVASRGDDGLAEVVCMPNVSVNEAAQTRPSRATYIHRLMSASRGPTSTYRTRRLGCHHGGR